MQSAPIPDWSALVEQQEQRMRLVSARLQREMRDTRQTRTQLAGTLRRRRSK